MLVALHLCKPLIEPLDMALKVGAELLQRTDFPISLRQMPAQHIDDLPFRLHAAGVGEVKIDDIADFFQAQAQLLELVDFLQAGKRHFGVVMLALAFTLTRRNQPNALVVANGTRRDVRTLRKFTNAHTVIHGPYYNVTLTSYLESRGFHQRTYPHPTSAPLCGPNSE